MRLIGRPYGDISRYIYSPNPFMKRSRDRIQIERLVLNKINVSKQEIEVRKTRGKYGQKRTKKKAGAGIVSSLTRDP